MKRVLGAVGAPLFFLLPNITHAVPMYYLFEGTVTGTRGPVEDLQAGDEVYYVFLVDFDQEGKYTTTTYGNATTFIWVDTASTDFFFADYVSGTHMTRPATGSYGFMANWGDQSQTAGELVGSPVDLDYNDVTLWNDIGVRDWRIGTTVSARDIVADPEVSEILSTLTLRSISNLPTSSVPEPSTLLLLGSGLLGLVGLNRRRNK